MTSKPVFRTGANIDRLVEKNERYRNAELHAKGNLQQEHIAQWHTNQYRVLKCATHLLNNYDVESNTQGEQELHHQVRETNSVLMED